MKEIVFIRQSAADMGGVEWQILKLAEKLFSRGCFKPVLITSDSRSLFAENFAACGFEVAVIPIGRIKLLAAAEKITHILENRNVAVIQTHLLRENFIGRAVRKKRPDIRHIFRAETYADGTSNPRWKKSLFHLLDKMTSRWVDYFIVNGKYLSDEVINRSGISPEKVIVLLNGRDQIGPPDKACDKPNNPLPTKIAMVANFIQGKGHDCLIESLAILKKRNLIIEARLLGSGVTAQICGNKKQNNEPVIKKLADKFGVSGQIEFYGYTKDVSAALAGIPVIVLPSDSEGVPNCILEAMSLRKLVIASNTGGVGEIIDDKTTGLLCRPKDPVGLANLLQYVFTHKAKDFEQMRTAGFEKWQKEFTAEKMVDNLVEIYRKIGVL